MDICFIDSELERFIHSLDDATYAKVLRTLDLLEHFGHKLGLPHNKNVGERLFELRVRGNFEVRIFYIFHSGDALLVHGFIKKSRRIPKKELAKAVSKIALLTQR